ncbi:DUF3077 domain-containing protein [Pseudomonas sp. PDM03]|jgi:hypothetical protein|uniref:DUF3077 domain-containing protein n=1 Tax=Pseudomonas sp. PDM03 TaxID=2769266 RepID=UPI0017804C92|nr:DUF3077 domain-containing protein [Pseudomonas sp. PDM03]MBD9591080.1 DUF3077 domain-containing protein [Pseudomonas sp. PDM03]
MSPQTNITTQGLTAFAQCGDSTQMLFRLSANVPLTDALEHASNLLSCATRMSLLATHGDGAEDCAMAAHYLSEMSKAVIDDVTTALLKSEAGHVQ